MSLTGVSWRKAVEIVQPHLNHSPPLKVLPKYHTTEGRKAWHAKPLTRSGVRNASQDGEFLRVQRLGKPAFLHHLVEPHVTELFFL